MESRKRQTGLGATSSIFRIHLGSLSLSSRLCSIGGWFGMVEMNLRQKPQIDVQLQTARRNPRLLLLQ